MEKIVAFDPPLCCPTGVCGPSVDPKLSRFAADLDWLKKKGVAVERFNLAQQPGEFAGNEIVRTLLGEKGNACLPLVLVGDTVVASGGYPSRKELAEIAGVAYEEPAPSLVLPMAGAGGGCCPAPDSGSTIEAAGEYCPWPRQNGGRCC